MLIAVIRNSSKANLSRCVGKESDCGDDTAVRKSCRSTYPAGQKCQGALVAFLSTIVVMGRGKAHNNVHISEILPREDTQDPF